MRRSSRRLVLPRRREQLAELRSADGDDLGTFETNESRWQVGDEFRAAGNVRYRITAIVPRERMAEFVDEPEVELWEVESAEI